MLICCIHLLYDWWFHLCHQIACICYFVESYLFSLLIWLVLMVLSCAAIRRDSVSLLKFPFLSHVQVLSCEILFTSRLNCPIELFSFPFLFPSYCHSVVHRVLSFVSSDCNESSFVCLYIVFESFYRCVNAVFNAGKSSSSLFSWNIVCQRRLWDVMSYAWSFDFLFFGPFV